MKKRVVLSVLLFVFLGGIVVKMFVPQPNPTLKVGFLGNKPIADYEPTNIHFVYEYLLLENIYSPLVELDPSGQLVPGVAESFRWENDSLHLKIRQMRTQNGTPITPDDIVFSLKRLLVLSQNTHGNFKDVICPGKTLHSVADDCPGIRSEGQEVILTPADAGKMRAFLLPMLAAIDFAIIPKSSVDSKTLKILNFKETSGPYFVDQDDGNGHTVLKINPLHYHASQKMAQTVLLKPTSLTGLHNAMDAFAQGDVDHLMTSNGAKLEDLLAYAKSHSDVDVHATAQIRKHMLVFTNRGMKELSLEQRRWIGSLVKASILSKMNGVVGYETADQFFPPTGDGSLSKDELHTIALNRPNPAPIPALRIGMLRAVDLENWAGVIRENIPSATIYREMQLPELYDYSEKAEEEPHAFIASVDTGFLEDIGLLSYWLNAGLLGLSKSERQIWLAKYMATGDQKTRLLALHDLHLNAIENAAAVPLLSSSFIAITRKPWKMDLSNLFVNNQLWLVKHD
jgi:MarR-like DNA-binding transcriptional regulator SgrR of sgrS sRNA